jgi:hypothetical protein
VSAYCIQQQPRRYRALPLGYRYAWDQRHKLYDDGRFFDIAADPLERAPIAEARGEAGAARKKLQAVLNRYRAGSG